MAFFTESGTCCELVATDTGAEAADVALAGRRHMRTEVYQGATNRAQRLMKLRQTVHLVRMAQCPERTPRTREP
jgi:hypothetical protein